VHTGWNSTVNKVPYIVDRPSLNSFCGSYSANRLAINSLKKGRICKQAGTEK